MCEHPLRPSDGSVRSGWPAAIAPPSRSSVERTAPTGGSKRSFRSVHDRPTAHEQQPVPSARRGLSSWTERATSGVGSWDDGRLRARADRGTVPGGGRCPSHLRGAGRSDQHPGRRHPRARDRGSGRRAPAEPVPRALVQRPGSAGACPRARARRTAGRAHRGGGAHRGGARRPVPDDRRPQGARRVRLPGARGRHGRLRPDDASRGVALDGELLPRWRGDQPDHGLPRRRRAARGHEPRALRVAGALGRRPRRHHPDARRREQRAGDLRRVQAPGAGPDQRDLEPVLRVPEPPRARDGHRPCTRARVRDGSGARAGAAAARVRLGDGIGRHDRGR